MMPLREFFQLSDLAIESKNYGPSVPQSEEEWNEWEDAVDKGRLANNDSCCCWIRPVNNDDFGLSVCICMCVRVCVKCGYLAQSFAVHGHRQHFTLYLTLTGTALKSLGVCVSTDDNEGQSVDGS